jgi:hypothetical protein
MILENMAFPTPGFSDAPITAMDCGSRKLLFDRGGLRAEENVEGKEDEEEGVPVAKCMEKVSNSTYKCLYTP